MAKTLILFLVALGVSRAQQAEPKRQQSSEELFKAAAFKGDKTALQLVENSR